MCWSAVIGCSFNDNIRSAYFQSMHLGLALNAGEAYRLARALALEAAHVSALGTRRSRRSAMLIQRAEECASRSASPHAAALVTAVTGVVAALEGRWKQCVASCDTADEILRNECTGVAWERDTIWRFRLWSYVFMGNLSQASCQVPFLLKEAKERDDLYAVGNLATLVMPILHLAADDPLRARDELGGAIRPPEPAYLVDHFTCLYSHAQIDLYSGDGSAGLKRLACEWPLLRNAFLLRVQQVRILMRHLRARCALATAASASEASSMMRMAARDASRLSKENARWAAAFGISIRAALAYLNGGTDAARQLLAEAVSEFEAVDMNLYAAAGRRRLGQLVDGAEGRALIEQADAWMAGQGIRNPERMTAMLAPGFPD
ncbi:MAG: hypothetical protein HY288_09670 [Planctomycetia bacterium]|nr:hypothetical protein [Planctomycetia bacterium]